MSTRAATPGGSWAEAGAAIATIKPAPAAAARTALTLNQLLLALTAQTLEKDAKKLELARDVRRERHPYFEFGEVLLQIAIVSASVAILSTSRQMFWFSLVLAVVGAGLTVNGFVPIFSLSFLHHH